MKNPLIYIVLNGELKMSPGKAAAQAVHAGMMLSHISNSNFTSEYKRTVIVLEAKNAEQIKNLDEYLSQADIDADFYIDEGVNEVDAFSVTALAAGVFEADDEESRKIFEGFPLYNGHTTLRLCDSLGFPKEKILVRNNMSVKSGWMVRSAIKSAVKESE